jgi:hypothetical protein
MLLGHHRIRTDVGAAELGIVLVMVIVGTAPDAAGTQREDAKYPHIILRDARFGKDGMVLLVMVNHKKTQNEKPGKYTEYEFYRHRQQG